MINKHVSKMVLISAIVLSLTTPVPAGNKVADILAKVDQSLTYVQDSTYHGIIKAYRGGKVRKKIEFDISLKGTVMKRITFTAPGDIRGMVMLATKANHIYVFLPLRKRVRRIANHVLNQGFMGTDISPNDMTSSTFSVGWNAKMEKEDDNNYILLLTPKPEKKTTYAKARITVEKEYGQVTQIDYIDIRGTVAKIQKRENFKKFGNIRIPMLFTFKNPQKKTHSTMNFTDVKINSNIPDTTFNVRTVYREG